VLVRPRPGDPGWPSEADWAALEQEVGGRLVKPETPLVACASRPGSAECTAVLERLDDPYFLGDEVALTQASGYLDAWASAPSACAVVAADADDVAAAVRFAGAHRLRLVVKGGGHSYQGTSNCADSLLVWTRRLNRIVINDDFVPEGGAGRIDPRPAVTVGAGAIWMSVYNAVMKGAGRYVQGGGCMTVGVAGIVQSGGFGSFSRAYGLAAAGLLEAEVVTADGAVRTVNAYREPDLFWALKGGGGGTFGIVTRLTLRTRNLPVTFGEVSGRVKAQSDGAFLDLIRRVMGTYRVRLFNPHWGEQIRLDPDNTVRIGMVFQGLSRDEAADAWQPLVDWVDGAPDDLEWERPLSIVEVPAQRFWDAEFLAQIAPERIVADDRPAARPGEFFWAGNRNEAGQFMHGYRSAWLPASLLDGARRERLASGLFAGSRHCEIALHFNKALAGAPADDIATARETAMNPIVVDAFALAVVSAEGPPAFEGMPGEAPDLAAARRNAAAIGRAFDEVSNILPERGSYVSESDFFERDWQTAFWGANYPRLAAIKRRYDPDGLFFVHHGVGSEEWSADGFTRRMKTSDDRPSAAHR
jgi:hypothetical protein